MSFMPAGKLPEKPWQTEVVARFLASIIVCWLSGMVVLTMVHYLEGTHKSSTAAFLACSSGTLACFTGSVIVIMRPWPFERFLRKLLLLLMFLYGGFFLMWLAERLVTDNGEIESSIVSMLIAVLAFQGAAVVLAHFFVRQHHTGWGEGFGFDNETAHALLIGACAGMLVLPVALSLQYVSFLFLERLNFHPHEQEIVTSLRTTDAWNYRLVMGLVTIVIAPLGEEILFRGVLYPWIKRIGYPRLALWVTALVFAAIHFNLAAFVPLVLLAVVLVWLYEYTGNLLACIMTHSIFNAANFIALYTVLSQK